MGALHAVVLRAPFAHARITGIDAGPARAAPGVRAVYTGADLALVGVADIACMATPPETPWAGIQAGDRFRERHQPILATDRVRFVGECVAFVVAGTRVQALDASERIEVAYEPLPAVTAVDEASGGTPVWDDVADNVSFRWAIGDRAATEAAFAGAHRIVRRRIVNNRAQLCPLEARGVVAEYDGRPLDPRRPDPNAARGAAAARGRPRHRGRNGSGCACTMWGADSGARTRSTRNTSSPPSRPGTSGGR